MVKLARVHDAKEKVSCLQSPVENVKVRSYRYAIDVEEQVFAPVAVVQAGLFHTIMHDSYNIFINNGVIIRQVILHKM